MDTNRIVVVGGVAAGMSAASAAKRITPDTEVVALERGEFVSYASCGIPYYLSEVVKDHLNLVAVTAEEFREKRGIDLRTMHEVKSIDAEKKIVEVLDREADNTYELEWSKLVIATGARAFRPPIEGMDAPNVFMVHSLQDGLRVMGFIRDRNPQRAVILGAGYVGLELAETFRARGMVVSIVQRSDRIMRGLEPEVGEKVVEELDRQGVILQRNTAVKSFERNNGGEVKRVITDKGEIEVDIVVAAVGVKPNTELAQKAGIEIGKTGAIATNDRMQTCIPDIYSAGDCAEAWHRILERPEYAPLGTTANKQGRIAGTNAAGSDERFPGVIGSMVAKVFDLAVARTGLGLKEAIDSGFDAASNTITARSRAHYYPGAKPITISLILDSKTGRLLGAQLTGADGTAKRNDVLATAITSGMTIGEIEYLDLCYAPPYSPVYDPILVAARQARKKLHK